MWKASCCIGITVSSGPSTSVVCGTVTTCAASPLRQSAQNAHTGQRIREQHRLEAARPAARRRCCACGTCRSVLAGCARKDARLIVAHRGHAETYCTILQVVALYCNRLHYNATCGTIKDAQLIVVAVGDHNQLSAARTDLFDVALDLHSQATSVERIESMVHLLR